MHISSCSHEIRSQTKQTREGKEENKRPIGKQTTNQNETQVTRGGKGEKQKETGREKKSKLNKCIFQISIAFLCIFNLKLCFVGVGHT